MQLEQGPGVMRKVQLTVLLATRNGERILPRTLSGYTRLVVPPVNWKIVVIDNGSTDGTLEIIKMFQKDLPLELIQEPMLGKSRALNTGITAIEGDLAVLTDDDSIPDPRFLQGWSKLLNSRHEYGIFAGRIEPLFDIPPPQWLIETRLHFSTMFSARDLCEGPVAADEIYGPNMAVRRSAFDLGLRFDENLGPYPLERMGQESEFCERASRAGIQCWFTREPLVQHVIRPHQLTASSWGRRAYRTGRGRAYTAMKAGLPLRAPEVPLKARLAMFSPLTKHRFHSVYRRYLARGFRDECTRHPAIVDEEHLQLRTQPERGGSAADRSTGALRDVDLIAWFTERASLVIRSIRLFRLFG